MKSNLIAFILLFSIQAVASDVKTFEFNIDENVSIKFELSPDERYVEDFSITTRLNDSFKIVNVASNYLDTPCLEVNRQWICNFVLKEIDVMFCLASRETLYEGIKSSSCSMALDDNGIEKRAANLTGMTSDLKLYAALTLPKHSNSGEGRIKFVFGSDRLKDFERRMKVIYKEK